MPKLIREGRFGPPKTFKTGAVVGTYPRPLLVLEMDAGGLDVIPATPHKAATAIKIDIEQKDVVFCTPDKFSEWSSKPTTEQPQVLCLDLTSAARNQITLDIKPLKNPTTFPMIVTAINALLSGKCPWKTVVLDNTTSLSDAIYGYFASANEGIFADARKWAPAIGDKVKYILMECCKLPCHFVAIMHEDTDKNETTGEIRTEPMIYSKYRQIVGGGLSQFFYQCKRGGQPKILTNDNGFIKGLGPRWPELPNECGVTFNDIYGEAVKRGEIVL